MSLRRRNRGLNDEPSGNERWLVSYADFITLMFAFFVVMYASSTVNENKYKVLSDSLVGVFKQQERATKPIPIGDERPRTRTQEELLRDDGGPMPDEENDPLAQITRSVEQAFAGLIEAGQLIVRGTESWVEIELKSSLLFPSGDALPQDAAFDIIEKVAKILAPFDNPIQVEGFTDNLPISTPLYPTNWELSAARAASIVRMLHMDGVAAQRMAAVGYGEHQPVADNSTASGRAQNRRVVLVISRFLDTRRSADAQGNQRQAVNGMQPAKSPIGQGTADSAVNSPAVAMQAGSGSR
ncbi:flagellar motor protein MotD [Pseudomonas sp.]|uniref:flagellar motor protein MotD n=1 Tax=Pseudomonas sp. TaxID=306 RepID=UPI001A0E313A|nr:flagellar motor protein MotD [Pseudomonas sp.]MBF0674585.1 flagellar motor protein MotD [Pseudomonas sp.]MBF0675923.1 flagellar motor protein MotD [Pseudomonas sp.]